MFALAAELMKRYWKDLIPLVLQTKGMATALVINLTLFLILKALLESVLTRKQLQVAKL